MFVGNLELILKMSCMSKPKSASNLEATSVKKFIKKTP